MLIKPSGKTIEVIHMLDENPLFGIVSTSSDIIIFVFDLSLLVLITYADRAAVSKYKTAVVS
jgi:hypothetical protein